MVLLISFHRFYIMRSIFLHDVEPLTRCHGARIFFDALAAFPADCLSQINAFSYAAVIDF